MYAPLIDLLTQELGYQGRNSLRALPYDWRIAPRRLEERDGFMSSMKADIEQAVRLNGRPCIVFAHSMGNLVLLYFIEWLKLNVFRGRPKAWQAWIDGHIWCYVGLGAPLLGSAGALKTVMDGETFGLQVWDSRMHGASTPSIVKAQLEAYRMRGR